MGFTSLVIVDAINVCLPLLVKVAIDALPTKRLSAVLWAGIGYAVLMGVQAVGRYLWRVYLTGTSHLIARELRMKLYEHLQRLPLSYYHKIRAGDLMSRATNDIESIRMAVGPGILVAVDAAFVFVMIIPAMLWLSLKLTLLAFAFYPLVPWITARLGDRIDALFERMQSKMSQLSAYTHESFSAIRLIKSLVLEDRVRTRFLGLSEEYQSEGVRQATYQAAFSPALGLLMNLGVFLILIVGGTDVIHGAITLGTFVAFQRFVVQLSWPMEAIGWAVTMNKEGYAAHRRLVEVMQIPQVREVTHAPPRRLSPATASLLEIRSLHHQFSGEKSKGPSFVLDVEHLDLLPCRKVGLVGPVGAGKSTLFNLILRLFEPEEGSIFWRGVDVTGTPLSVLRKAIASVEQQIFLFSETIAVNISMGSPFAPTREEVERAARSACIFDEVLELPDGLDTVLGERGVNLSGGQKQRLALARALVRKPDLLLLDDSFSAVDVGIEEKIIENLFSQYPDLALCFASHRLSVMPRMDEIWLMERGVISQRGSHQELLRKSGLYQALWKKSEKQEEAELFGIEMPEPSALEERAT